MSSGKMTRHVAGVYNAAMADAEPIRIDDTDRFDRLRLISWWDQARLETARVIVGGAGALGNEVCKNLALLGVGNVLLVDFDTVETANLSRGVLLRDVDVDAAKAEVVSRRMTDLNPAVKVFPLVADMAAAVGGGWFTRADLALGCFDNREARLAMNQWCCRCGIPYVDGGILELSGQVRVFLPADACYECGLTRADWSRLDARTSCPGLPRDSASPGRAPTTPTAAAIIAGMQVQEGLKFLHHRGIDHSTAVAYQGDVCGLHVTRLPRRASCLAHDRWPDPEATGLCAARATPADLFSLFSDRLGRDGALQLPRDHLISMTCPSCEAAEDVGLPSNQTAGTPLACPKCGSERIPRWAHRVGPGTALAEQSLAALGIPAYDVVRLDGTDATVFAVLDGDRPEGW